MFRTVKPHIIVEEPEEDEEEEEVARLKVNDCLLDQMKRTSAVKLSLKRDSVDSASPSSPTPSTASCISRNEFESSRLDEVAMKNMVFIGVISDWRQSVRVEKYINRANMVQYAVIKINLLEVSKTEMAELWTDLEKVTQYRHKRLASIYGYYEKDSTIYIFRSFLPAESVADRLKKSTLEEALVLKYTRQLLGALIYLHERSRVHGNITTSNLLLTLSGDIQLSDIRIRGLPINNLRRRSLLYAPPEAFLLQNNYPALTMAADVWQEAVGCTLVAMITRFPPFQDFFLPVSAENLQSELIAQWEHHLLSYTSFVLTPSASPDFRDFVDHIFIEDPNMRPTAAQIFELLQSSMCNSRKTSMRASLASLMKKRINQDKKVTSSVICSAQNIDGKENNAQKAENSSADNKRATNQKTSFVKWYLSRIIIFSILLVKWIGMVLCAATSLGLVAGSVFFSIFIIYSAIQLVCGCQLNEGFVVLIALILLPIILLLVTLCCNNSLEKYHADIECGKVENSKYVRRTPEENIVLCGVIVIDGRPSEDKGDGHTAGAVEETEPAGNNVISQLISRGDFLSGVARIA